jgi:hypothetical protein
MVSPEPRLPKFLTAELYCLEDGTLRVWSEGVAGYAAKVAREVASVK